MCEYKSTYFDVNVEYWSRCECGMLISQLSNVIFILGESCTHDWRWPLFLSFTPEWNQIVAIYRASIQSQNLELYWIGLGRSLPQGTRELQASGELVKSHSSTPPKGPFWVTTRQTGDPLVIQDAPSLSRAVNRVSFEYELFIE